MIDLGLAKRYKEIGGKHIEYNENGNVVGTLKFASVNSHLGLEQSRRDDLESIGLLLIYLRNGKLPWENIDNYSQILDMKVRNSVMFLCKTMEPEFLQFMTYCRELKFEECPNYDFLKGIFRGAMDRLKIQPNVPFIWDLKSINQRKTRETTKFYKSVDIFNSIFLRK